jgi:hypothetical protein
LADSRRDRHVGAPDLVRRLDRWLDRQEPDALEYLIEENRILRAQLGGPTLSGG